MHARRACGKLLLAAVVTLLGMLGAAPAGARQPAAGLGACAPGVELLGFSDALDKTTFAGTHVGGLSGLAYDRHRGVYYSVVDNEGTTPARFYTLALPIRNRKPGDPTILDVTTLRNGAGQPFTGATIDAEGIALTNQDELLVSSETEPSIRGFSLAGRLLETLPVPAKYLIGSGRGVSNHTFESLALSPNEQHLFAAVEYPLVGDDYTPAGDGRDRILRYDRRGSAGFQPAAEYYYLADPTLGISDMIALSDSELLVLERGFTPGFGNTVRIYQVSLRGARNVANVASLANATLAPLRKTLLVDVADCPSGGAPLAPGATQQNPLLDNFEGMAFGPLLPNGQQSLVVESDDNFGRDQHTRVIVLGVELRR